MLSLVLTVFFVHVAIYLVNTIGASTIDGLVCIQQSHLWALRSFPAPPHTYIVILNADTTLLVTVMAPLPKTADINLTDCTQAAAVEAPSPRAEA